MLYTKPFEKCMHVRFVETIWVHIWVYVCNAEARRDGNDVCVATTLCSGQLRFVYHVGDGDGEFW